MGGLLPLRELVQRIGADADTKHAIWLKDGICRRIPTSKDEGWRDGESEDGMGSRDGMRWTVCDKDLVQRMLSRRVTDNSELVERYNIDGRDL